MTTGDADDAPVPFISGRELGLSAIGGNRFAFRGQEILCHDDTSETTMKYDGKSWTLTRKDLKSGGIERFTQSGTGSTGRLEVIHGKPGGTPGTFAWSGVEDKGAAQLKSRRAVPLPKSMWRDVESALITAPELEDSGLGNILTTAARTQLGAETRALTNSLNGAEHRPGTRAHGGKLTPAPH